MVESTAHHQLSQITRTISQELNAKPAEPNLLIRERMLNWGNTGRRVRVSDTR